MDLWTYCMWNYVGTWDLCEFGVRKLKGVSVSSQYVLQLAD